MLAVLCEAFGPPEALVLRELPDPAPGDGQVLIEVRACGINFPDVLMLEGKYQNRPEFPFSPGAEVAGVVRAAGRGVTLFKPGDEVVARTGAGGLRELVVVDVARCFAKPGNIGFEEAAGLLLNYGTALHALDDRAGLKAGEVLVVLGAGGGVGLSAVEVGRVLGARVVAAASTPEKLALAQSRGAEATVLYPTGRIDKEAQRALTEEIRRQTGGGADVVFDPVGGDHAEPVLRAMAWRGRYLVVGFASGEIEALPANLMLLKGCDIRGVNYGGLAQNEPDAQREQVAMILDWVAGGVISPAVGEAFPLARAPEALRRIADRKASGKIIVTVP